MWAQQMSVLDLPATGFVVTTDVGDLEEIHPPRKQEVGERAALWALATVYGKKDLVWSGPVMKSVTTREDKAIVAFDHVGSGLSTRDGKPPSLFELAGSDGKFVSAKATIKEQTVVVTSTKVPAPKRVRFGWTGVKFSNLVNAEGLPTRPFSWTPVSENARRTGKSK
jgi:sialate O-acetylesterase